MQPWNEDAFVNKLFPKERQNDINTSCSTRYVYESNEIRITRLAAQSFLVFAGVLFNIIICVLNLKHSNINAAIRVYLRNMAVADIGVLLIGFLFAVAKEQEGTSKWVLGGVACRYIYPVTDMFYAVTVWTVVAIAVERCHIMKGDSGSWNSGPSRGLRTVLILWFTAFFAISVPLFFASNYKSSCGRRYCFIRWPTASDGNNIPPKIHSLFLLFVIVILPVVVILVSCCRLAFGYRHSSGVCNPDRDSMRQRLRSDNSENSEQDEVRHHECDDAKRFLTPLVILLVISTIPMLVLRTIFIFSSQKLTLENYLVLLNISIMLTVCNSAVRPFVYYVVSQDVRDGFSLLVNRVKRRLRMCCRKHDETTIPLQDNVAITRHSCYKETTL
ncbi:blue-sensitive opsin-like [Actinia tenebrosa]|uniref:Blue-sensitive opsin-like n=1 Tax=Actinia tenebrosa TaxID=6105 RepID=A0A6P8IN52_ACTTE|nr:blue-sensitive opsin-like [Actinia tenebrosa]